MIENNSFDTALTILKEKGEFSCISKGISMYPMLRDGQDIVFIKPAVFPLKRNAVALYKRKGTKELVLHRVIKRSGDTYIIRGDNTYHREFVDKSDIAGVLFAFTRNGKYHLCETDFLYHIYVFFMRVFYPLRVIYKRITRNFKKTK